MPGCVLRVGSTTTHVEPLIEACGLRPVSRHRKRQPRLPGAQRLSRVSGFTVDVSRRDTGIEQQAVDAIRFLRRHRVGLQRLRQCKTYDGMTLDFGLYDRATARRPWPTYRLPAELIALAGQHGIEIELSFYGRHLTTASRI